MTWDEMIYELLCELYQRRQIDVLQFQQACAQIIPDDVPATIYYHA